MPAGRNLGVGPCVPTINHSLLSGDPSMSRRATALLLALLCSLTSLHAVIGGTASAGASVAASARAEFTALRLGDTGWTVRVLQSRLHQLDLHSEVVTSRFDRETKAGVTTFQRRRGWSADGVVDERTWLKITAITTAPTQRNRMPVSSICRSVSSNEAGSRRLL